MDIERKLFSYTLDSRFQANDKTIPPKRRTENTYAHKEMWDGMDQITPTTGFVKLLLFGSCDF